jgi:hypothetical protein
MVFLHLTMIRRTTPVRRSMHGADEKQRIALAEIGTGRPSGFIWKDGVIVNTNSCVVNVPGLEFTHRNSSAFFSEVEYNA